MKSSLSPPSLRSRALDDGKDPETVLSGRISTRGGPQGEGEGGEGGVAQEGEGGAVAPAGLVSRVPPPPRSLLFLLLISSLELSDTKVYEP